jgi:RNA polymerase-binding transcription factor DksA
VFDAAYDATSDAGGLLPDAALLDQVNAELGAVDEALRRLDDGSYGSCQVCGAHLDARRLEEDPLLVLCPDHER